MRKFKKILLNRSGLAAPLACIIVISLFIIVSGIMELIRIQIIANGVRDTLQSAVISVATQNHDEVYGGLREGYAGAYELSVNDLWYESVDQGDIYGYLDNTLGLDREGIYHIKLAGGKLEYRLHSIEIYILNVPFAPDDTENINKFTTDVKIILEVPVYFFGVELLPMKTTLRVGAGYSSKFN